MINLKKFTKVSIIGFGGYLPFYRIKLTEIANNWEQDGEKIQASLGVEQKAVCAKDEDSLTMAVEASLIALKRAKLNPQKIGAIFVGSESHPYAVKPTGTILGEILGVGQDYFCADLQFACKAGTAGMQIIASMIESGLIDYGLVVGTDKSQARPGDALEYTAGAGAAAFVLGKRKSNPGVDLMTTYSFSSDTPDFWRRSLCQFPSHSGRFTGEPGYFYHVEKCLKNFLKRIAKKPEFFDQVVFHMPNSKFPLKIAKKFGFNQKQLATGFLVPSIGNPYSASSLLGLVAVLEQAKVNQNILLISYGSGAGSDAMWLRTATQFKKLGPTINDYLVNFKNLDYVTYLRNYQAIKQ